MEWSVNMFGVFQASTSKLGNKKALRTGGNVKFQGKPQAVCLGINNYLIVIISVFPTLIESLEDIP
ncbi:MAG: hypothetical protein N3I35_10925 [Clostridia bacterium]|nr:hypothetical protein [Clostridia bacterium]